MNKNKSFIKFALLSFLTVVLLISLFYGFSALIGIDLNSISNMNFLYLYVGSILYIYVPFIFVCFCINFSYKFGKKVVDIESGLIDINKDKKYFRDILNEYSVLELAYVNNNKLEKKDILAEILSLELKKVIKLENNQVVSIDRNIAITKSEEYLLSKCISGKVKLDRLDIITEMTKNEVIKNGILEKENNIFKDIILMFLKTDIISFLSIVTIIVLSEIINNDVNEFLSMIIGLIILVLVCFCIYKGVYLVSYIIHKIKSYKLTDKGKNIKSKLEGLKKYIKDFGNLDDDNKESLNIWQYYLIYSIMFGLNNVIVSEMEDFLEIEERFKISSINLFIIIFTIILFLFIIF